MMANLLDPRVFRMYDIRGEAGTQITSVLAKGVGQALGTRIRRAGGTRAAVARDVRHSSPELARHVVAGLAATGVDVQDFGVAPTPVLYHALHRSRMDPSAAPLDGGVIVTASHNPRGDNGLKVCLGNAPLWGDDVASLRDQILADDFERGSGQVSTVDHQALWLAELCARFRYARQMKVVVDAGNGVMGPPALEALGRLGVDVVPLYCDPDGDFPHHIPDPQEPGSMRALSREVLATGAQAGLAFDGDGDRFGLVDETGALMVADRVLALFARQLLAEHPGGLVRFDVKCSQVLSEVVRAAGGVPLMGRTGHSLLKRDVLARDAILGGELSGHFVFNRGWLPIDDALYAALYLLELLDRSGEALSALFAGIPERPATPEIKLPCADEDKFEVVAALQASLSKLGTVESVDGIRVTDPSGAWFLVRASNTSPALTVRMEARTEGQLSSLGGRVLEALSAHPAVDLGPLAEYARE